MSVRQINIIALIFSSLIISQSFCTTGESHSLDVSAKSLIVTEFLAKNMNNLADEDGEYSDWIEIFNPNDEPFNIGGWCLSDDPEDWKKWSFPEMMIEKGAYLLIFASGKDRKDPGSDLHTNFKLAAEGEYLSLMGPNSNEPIQEFGPFYPKQRRDVSYGLYGDKECFFRKPTPGYQNENGLEDKVSDISISHGSGIANWNAYVYITTQTKEAIIRYTTDGTEPSISNGISYTSPIFVNKTCCLNAIAFKENHLSSRMETRSYIDIDDVINQPILPIDVPVTWNGHTADYEMDPDVVNDPTYSSILDNCLLSIPSLSLVMPMDNWFDSNGIGIYANPQLKSSERQISAELLSTGSEDGFQIDCAIEMQGGSSSTDEWLTDKKSMRLIFKEPYGPTKLNYPLFGENATESFDTIILDSVFDLSWTFYVNSVHRYAQYTRDQFVADLQNELGGHAPHGRFVHLYLNGLYWGIYNIHERPDESFAESYLGGSKDDYDIIKHNPYRVVNGDNSNYLKLIEATDRDLRSDDNYQEVVGMLDINSFIDYMIINIYAGNWDWGNHNWYASFNRMDQNAQWRFHSWDAELTLQSINQNVIGKNDHGGPTGIHANLMNNSEYRILFADRVYRHLFNNGALTSEKVVGLYERMTNEIDRAIVCESARWGDNRRDDPYTRNVDWVKERDRLRDKYFPNRTGIVIEQLRDAGYYPSIDAPVLSRHGGEVPKNYNLEMSTSEGEIFYTIDGTDPRIHKKSSEKVIKYDEPIVLKEDVRIKARSYHNETWSALNEAFFFLNYMIAVRLGPFQYDDGSIVKDRTLILKADTGEEFEVITNEDGFAQITNGLSPGTYRCSFNDNSLLETDSFSITVRSDGSILLPEKGIPPLKKDREEKLFSYDIQKSFLLLLMLIWIVIILVFIKRNKCWA